MNKKYLAHYGILGMKWGVRRFQNEDGTLTKAGVRRYEKMDSRWVKKQSDKVYEKAIKESRPEMSKFIEELKTISGRPGVGEKTLINKYNSKLAEVMRTKTKDIRSPSGKVVEWVAKRGSVGVFMALADQGYDISKLKKGVWDNGRMAYRSKKVDMQNSKGG